MRRYQVGHTTLNTNQLIRIDIIDALQGSASSDELVGDGTIQYSHQRLDPSQYTEIQSGELAIGVHIQTNAHRTFRDDVLTSSEGRFQLKLYFDNVLEWAGDVLPDLSTYTESSDEVLTLKAKDFTLLKKDLFPLEDKRETIYTTIARILSGFSLDIVSATSWVEENVVSEFGDVAFLNKIYHETKALRQFAEPDDRQITNEEALKWILRNYVLTLRQSGGKLRIDQFTAYSDPTSVHISTNGADGGAQSLTQTSSPITIDSTNQGNPAIRRVDNTFNHRTQDSVILFPSRVKLSGSETRTIPFDIVPANLVIGLRTTISAIVNAVGELGDRGNVITRITAGQYHWTGTEWDDTVTNFNRFFVTTLNRVTKRDSVTPDKFDYEYTGDLSILTSEIPSDATSGLEVEFRPAQLGVADPFSSGAREASQVVDYLGINFEAEFEDGNSTAIRYQLTNSASFTKEVTHPVTYFGDGPDSNSFSALRYSTVFSKITSSSWQRRGSTDYRLFHENLLHEILDGRRGFRRVLNATIKDTFEPHKVLSYDGEYFYYLGGTFDGYTGNWSVQVVQILVQDLDEQIQQIATDGIGSSLGSGSSVNFSLENLRRILLLAGVLGITNADYDEEEITEIDLDLNQPLREGFEYWIINSKELSGSDVYEGIYPFMPDIVGTSNSGLVTLAIDEQTMNAPKGSLVILAPSQAATNQTRMESISSETIGDVTANAQAIVAVDSRVTVNEGDITANASAILTAESDITGIETNYRSFIYQGTAPTLRPDGSALQTGDVWINTTGGENRQSVWNGTAWVRSNADFDARISTNASATLTLESEVDVIDGRVTKVSAKAALVVDAGGTIGSISLEADGLTGFSEIDIKASQVTINGVLFDDDGMMRSTSFDGTIVSGVATSIGTLGWAIDRSGQAIFHNILIRGGSIDGIDLRGNVGNIQIFDTVGDLPTTTYTDGSAVEEGDAAYVKTKPDSLYRYDGDDWISTVDGADILANSIVAGKIDVATLSAITANLGNVVVGGTTGGSLVMRNLGVIKNAIPDPLNPGDFKSTYEITDTGFTVTNDADFDINLGSSGTIKGTNYTLSNTGLTVTGSATFDITMGATGEITNTSGTYRVDESGFSVIGPTASNQLPNQNQSFSMFSGTNLVGLLGGGTIGSIPSIILRSANSSYGLTLAGPTGNKIEWLPISASGDGAGNIKVHLTGANTATGKMIFAGLRTQTSGISELPINSLIVDSNGFLKLKLS